jgi:uracil-DNA glycosylase
MEPILKHLEKIELKILIGAYSQSYFLKTKSGDLTETVRNWKSFAPENFPLPHPSPRNNIWLAKNPWFEKTLVPGLQAVTKGILN